MTGKVATKRQHDIDKEVLSNPESCGHSQRWEEEAEDHDQQREAMMFLGRPGGG